MSLSVTSIASGSKGNCILIQNGTNYILVDIGIPLFYVEASLRKLGIEPNKISAVFLTHEHSDHTSGVQAFAAKYGTPVYMHGEAAGGIIKKLARISAHKIIEFGDEDFGLNDMAVSPFHISHDVHCTGFSFVNGAGKLSVLTDAGEVPDNLLRRIADSDTVLIESNHDVDMLKASKKYPPVLKRRILSPFGHLSNMACGDAISKLAMGGVTRNFILAHLSMENNYPELALSSVESVLKSHNIKNGDDVFVSVAEQYKFSQTVKIG